MPCPGFRLPIDKSDEGRQHVKLHVRLSRAGRVGKAAAFHHVRRQQALPWSGSAACAKRSHALIVAENRNRIVGFAWTGTSR